MDTLYKLQECYEKFLEKSEGADPDFPMHTFGGENGPGKTIAGRNAAQVDEEII